MQLSQKIMADNPRFLEDVSRSLEKYSKLLDELLSLQRMYVKQTAAMFLEVNLGPSTKLSPKIVHNESIKVSSMEKLRKNYAVIQELWAVRESFESMIVNVRQTFAHRGEDTTKVISEIEKLKKKTDTALQDAFEFVAGLAQENLPEKFAKFNKDVGTMLQNSIAYQDSRQFTYIHEVEGDVVFSTYFQLLQITDDDGAYYTEKYFVTSYRTGGSETGYYVGVLDKFLPPTDRLLMKRVSNMKDTGRAFNMILSLDHFTTSIGSLPIALMLKDAKIDRELLLYQQYVKSIRVDEEQIVLTLNTDVQEKSHADKIANQIYLDFKGITGKTGAAMKMGMKKAEKCWVITVFFVTARDTLLASEDDLSFLKERFNLSDVTLKSLVRTINQGSS